MLPSFFLLCLVVRLCRLTVVSTNNAFHWSLGSVGPSKGWIVLVHQDSAYRSHAVHWSIFASSSFNDTDVTMLFSVLHDRFIVCNLRVQLHPVELFEVFRPFCEGRFLMNLPIRCQFASSMLFFFVSHTIYMSIDWESMCMWFWLTHLISSEQTVLLPRCKHFIYKII